MKENLNRENLPKHLKKKNLKVKNVKKVKKITKAFEYSISSMSHISHEKDLLKGVKQVNKMASPSFEKSDTFYNDLDQRAEFDA